MRTILEELPGALMPDLQKESEDPGVERDVVDDDLVRPTVEDELPREVARGRRSPLSRHTSHSIGPLDRSLPLPLGLRLSLEGIRVTDVAVDMGFTHQALERRSQGRAVDVGLFALIARAEPGLQSALAVACAVERLGGRDDKTRRPSASTTAHRRIALDLLIIVENMRLLACPALRAAGGRLGPRTLARTAWRAAAGLLDGLCADDVFHAPFGVRRPLPAEEAEMLLRLLSDVEEPLLALDPARAFSWLEGVGRLGPAIARRLGVDGPALRASGDVDDTPGIDLEAAPPLVIEGKGLRGCAWSRLRVRHADAVDAAARLRTRLQALPDPEAEPPTLHDVADGIGTAQVRGPAGTTAALVAIAGQRVQRLRLRPPDLALVAALPPALVDVTLEDVAAVVASFGIRASAVDR